LFKEPGVASCRQVMDRLMGRVFEQTPYQCNRCGAASVVAAPLIYQRGTHTYSNRFGSGTSQSYSAQAVAPPYPRRYARPLFLWGPGILFSVFWGSAGVSAILRDSSSGENAAGPMAFLVCLGLICCLGMLLSVRRIARYNREVYPRLHWNWEHTYFCQRCGNSQLIVY
jgi:ribosomal protein L37E